MRFTLSSTVLSNRLSALAKVINSKNSMSILNDFVFEIEGTKLSLTASDNENTMTTSMEIAESDSNGSFAIGNHDILEAVKGFSEQPLEFNIDKEKGLAEIEYQNGHFSLPIENASEFPQPQAIEDGNATTIEIKSELLLENITRSLFATGQESIRPVMNGIYFDLTPECLAIVASDGHKLVRNKVFAIKSENPSSFILPKKPANLLKGTLSKDGMVTIKYDSKNAEINYGEGIINCRLIEGRYPNYASVIPQDNPNQLTVDRAGLLGALRRVQPFANESSDLIRFHVESGMLQIDAEDFDFSKTASEKIYCDYEGQPMSIGFKGSAFIDVLSNFDCQDVIIQLADPSRAGTIIPSEQPEGEDVLMLMMPMLINDSI